MRNNIEDEIEKIPSYDDLFPSNYENSLFDNEIKIFNHNPILMNFSNKKAKPKKKFGSNYKV